MKAVIFDMDGVITNTMPDHFRVWKKILAQEGISVARTDIYKREGQKGITSVREIFIERSKPFVYAQARKILQAKEEAFKKIVRRRFIPGSLSFLRFLSRQDFFLGLVTGTSRPEVHRILPDAVYRLFHVVITSNDVQFGKPHPQPYRKALKKLKLTASEAIVLENAPLGIRSAKAAGLRCLAIETSLPRRYLEEADYVFRSMAQLKKSLNFEALPS